MKRNLALASLALAVALLLTACGGGGSMAQDSMAPAASAPAASAPAASAPAAAAPAAGESTAERESFDMTYAPAGEQTNSSGQSIYQNADAKLIRRAQLTIQTTDFDRAAQALDELVTSLGGYFESASVQGGSYRQSNANRWGEYVIRIPAERYDAFLGQTGTLGYVAYQDESSEDIGEQYYDTEARLKTQRTKQERLLALLEKAENMEDIIALESALSDVEYQIEQYTSTLNRYDSLVGFATINLSLEQVTVVDDTPGQADSLGQRMAAGFVSSGRGLVRGVQDLLVWLSYHIFGTAVALAVVALIAVVIIRAVRKKYPELQPERKEKKKEETKE